MRPSERVQTASAWGSSALCPPLPESATSANLRVQARTRSAAGVLGTVQTLSAAGQDAFSPQVAANRAGAALVDWTRFDGAFDRTQAAPGP